MTKTSYMLKFDLKSAYHHIEIHEEHRQCLSFAWDFGDSVLRYFHFCVLPFGLSSAPFIFTKLLKPLNKCWRTQGIPIAVYLDDGLGAYCRLKTKKGYSFCKGDDFSFCLLEGLENAAPYSTLLSYCLTH